MHLWEAVGKKIDRLFSDRIVFQDGSYIEFCSRDSILYVERDRQLEITWDFCSWRSLRKRELYVNENFGFWDKPNEREPVSLEKESEILGKIKIYCSKKRIPLVVK